MAETKIDGRSREAKSEKARNRRTPFGVVKLKMSLDAATMADLKAKDLVPRWVNDEDHGQRIANAREGGYDFVEALGDIKVGEESVEESRRIKKLVGSNVDLSPKHAYLMAIPRKFYEEDQAKKEETNSMIDDAIRQGTPSGLKSHGIDPNMGGTYAKDINYKP